MVGIYHLLIDGNHIVQNGSVVKHNDKKMIKETMEPKSINSGESVTQQ